MNKITPIALIVTGGLSAQAANAAIITQTFDVIPGSSAYDVKIGGVSTAQYSYSRVVKPVALPDAFSFATLGNSQLTPIANASTMPTAQNTFTSNTSFIPGAIGNPKDGPGPNYVGLKFNIGTGSHYGIARFGDRFDDNGNFADIALKEVSYDDVAISAAVPEPESWALLIGGFGVAGAAVRRSRRREKLATA